MKLRGIGNNGFSFEGPALPFLTVRTVGDGFCAVNRLIVDSTPIGRTLDAGGGTNGADQPEWTPRRVAGRQRG